MGKKKKSKGKDKEVQQQDVLFRIDDSMNHRFEEMKLEIEFYQREIEKGAKKARKRALKDMKKKNSFYVPVTNNAAKEQVIRQMEGNNFFDRVMNILQEMVPIVRVIAELVKSLIVAILSVDSVKYRIKRTTLQSMQNVYNMANSVVALGQ